MIPVFAQIVQRLPGHLIESIASRQRIKAREFSYSSQLYTLMLGQFLHAFSLNELVDISEVHRAELSRIRGISPAKRNTLWDASGSEQIYGNSEFAPVGSQGENRYLSVEPSPTGVPPA